MQAWRNTKKTWRELMMSDGRHCQYPYPNPLSGQRKFDDASRSTFLSLMTLISAYAEVFDLPEADKELST